VNPAPFRYPSGVRGAAMSLEPIKTKKKKWKEFEELVAQVQKTLSPLADVRVNQKIRGKKSKRKRQVDIAIYSQVGQIRLLTIFECKDYKTTVDVEKVEAFAKKLSDVGANKGIMVSPIGFTASARNVAQDAGIDLYRLADTRDHDWKREITVPFYIKDTVLKAVQGFLQDLNGNWLPPQGDRELFNEKGEFVYYLQEILWDAWNDPKANTRQPGVLVPLIHDETLYVRADGHLEPVRIFAKLFIEYNVYFKNIPIYVSGFENVIEGSIHTSAVWSGPFELNDVRRNWKNLGNIDYKKLMQKGPFAFAMELKTRVPEEDLRKVLPNKGIHRKEVAS
jgi:hypothetical protein